MRYRYVALPEGWEDLEVPYIFHPQVLLIITYAGGALNAGDPEGVWKVLYTEWVWCCAVELIHQARRGRLWYLPPAVVKGIKEVGFDAICFGNASHAAELESLLYEISVIRWDRVPLENGLIPRFNDLGGPIYRNGDFVPFDVSTWATQMVDAMYIEEDDSGNPRYEVSRGPAQQGRLFAEVENPVMDVFGVNAVAGSSDAGEMTRLREAFHHTGAAV